MSAARRLGGSVRWLSTKVNALNSGLPTYVRNIAAYPNVQMHIGVGGFHRSHQAHYLHELLERQGTAQPSANSWALCGVGLMPSDAAMANALRSQDHLYTLLSQGSAGSSAVVIGSIMDFVLVTDNPASAIQRLADPAVKVVSLTITEKGYCLAVDGGLDVNNPLVAAELPPGSPPKSALGLLYGALAARRRSGVPPFTILSCDNLPGNGALTSRILLEFARARAERYDDAEAADMLKWMESGAVAFPSTMVDRITPMTEATHRALLSSDHGIDDACPVVAEEFKQWVVEDNFPNGRPPWEDMGALMVKGEAGVEVYEAMKLRMLNASHSAMAYVSYLSGHRLVADAMADPAIHGFVSAYLDEVIPTVTRAPGIDLPLYRLKLIERFANPHIKDTLLRLAEDGSQKLQTTMRDVLLEQLDAGRSFDTMSLAIGGWIRFMTGTDEQGQPIGGIKDPHAARLRELSLAIVAHPTNATVKPLLQEFFGATVGASDVAAASVAASVAALGDRGTPALLRDKYA